MQAGFLVFAYSKIDRPAFVLKNILILNIPILMQKFENAFQTLHVRKKKSKKLAVLCPVL